MKCQFIILHCMMDWMDSPESVHMNKVNQTPNKWSLTFLIILLPILPIYDLGQRVKLS
jgi:hypothetical protein